MLKLCCSWLFWYWNTSQFSLKILSEDYPKTEVRGADRETAVMALIAGALTLSSLAPYIAPLVPVCLISTGTRNAGHPSCSVTLPTGEKKICKSSDEYDVLDPSV